MYYPYFRGKQYDLIVIRECAELMAQSQFVPIIEPVKESTAALIRALRTLIDSQCDSVLIVNPVNGNHSTDPSAISEILNVTFQGDSHVRVGILLEKETSAREAFDLANDFPQRKISFIHSGFTDPVALVELLQDEKERYGHIFLDDGRGKRYQKHFKEFHRVLIKDGFEKRSNREHPDVEHFSDLHATYEDEGMDGFGDFLIVGDDYSESGGPAYAVAIHITYIDADDDDGMYIFHFKSDRNDTPTDPGGKFAEALSKLISEVNSGTTKVTQTEAIEEFRALSASGHFPGLGTVKKIAMKHHIQTLASYLVD
ncbi:sce7725 family protein [uncultured Deefgea sp.]|uniref:sce7725 family protein n=1 Tax=uncultured Deefgea sp. TaxID=1304914 RepID=UPI00263449EF|nr:sce7725 family protein [uncultured Deefgea sp.]